MNPSSVSLADIGQSVTKTGKKFVLVEESRLSELARFEDILREEKEKLGEQCLWILSDTQCKAHIPLPATRLAVHNFCESSMRRYAAQIMDLNAKWRQFVKANHYDRDPVYTKETYLRSAPLSQKTLKLKLVLEAAEVHRRRCNRDSMLYEDDLSFLVGKYQESRQRKVDYDRYFVLATRYGAYSEVEFYQDNFPGFRFWKNVTLAAVKFQKLWIRYWSFMRIKRYRAARGNVVVLSIKNPVVYKYFDCLFKPTYIIEVQKVWRRYWSLKVWTPIVKLRMKMGKLTYYRFCWKLWLHYNKICRRIREAIQAYKENLVSACFFSWRSWSREQKARKADILKAFVNRIKNGFLDICFRGWVSYTGNYHNAGFTRCAFIHTLISLISQSIVKTLKGKLNEYFKILILKYGFVILNGVNT